MGEIRGILVTGGAGFIGATLVRRLTAAGYLVRVLDNLSTGDAAHLSDVDAARLADVPRVLLASTGGALIGDAVPPVSERSLPRPLSPYGASKLAGEGYAHAFAKAYGMRTAAVRFGNVYGPWCARKRGVFNAFFGALRRGEPIVIYGDGSASPPAVQATRSSSGETGRNFASCDLARELLGYSPSVRLEDGVPRLWEWFEKL